LRRCATATGVVTLRRAVQWRDMDSVGHVNNAAYGDYIEDAARQAASLCGWPASRMAAEGFDLATRQLRIEYRQPVLPGDELAISTWLSELTEDGVVRHTTAARASDGELLAQSYARWGCVDAKTRTAMALPAAFSLRRPFGRFKLAPDVQAGHAGQRRELGQEIVHC